MQWETKHSGQNQGKKWFNKFKQSIYDRVVDEKCRAHREAYSNSEDEFPQAKGTRYEKLLCYAIQCATYCIIKIESILVHLSTKPRW